MDEINKCFMCKLEKFNKRRKSKFGHLSIYDHHLIKSNQMFSRNNLSSRVIYRSSHPELFLEKGDLKKVSWKYAANLQGNTHAEVRFL